MIIEYATRLLKSFFRKQDEDNSAFVSSCFDQDWYVQTYPEALDYPNGPWSHYDEIGYRKGLDPCEFFSTRWYLNSYPDIRAAGVNPLVHFELYGLSEGRLPSPSFDSEWYASTYGIDSDFNPLVHYLNRGRQAGFATSAATAIDSFRRGGSPFPRRDQFLSSLEKRLRSTGAEAFYQDRVLDGRSYSAIHGLDLSSTEEIDHIAHQMKREGSFSIPPYQVELQKVFVIPGSTLILANDAIINDEIIASSYLDPKLTQHKLWDRVWVNTDRVALRYKIEVTPKIQDGIHLFKEHDQNYFHFCCELMPKLFLLESIAAFPEVPLLVCDDLDDRLYQMLSFLKSSKRPLLKLKRNVPYYVDRLIYLSDISSVLDVYNSPPLPQHTFLPNSVLADMAAKIKLSTAPRIGRGRRLFIPRGSHRRAPLNERDVVDFLIRRDFEVVDINCLSFEAQVQLFSCAEFVIGGTGAALTNILWCNSGTRAIIFYPEHSFNNTTFWDRLGSVSGSNIEYLECPRAFDVNGIYSMHDSYTVDISALEALMHSKDG